MRGLEGENSPGGVWVDYCTAMSSLPAGFDPEGREGW